MYLLFSMMNKNNDLMIKSEINGLTFAATKK